MAQAKNRLIRLESVFRKALRAAIVAGPSGGRGSEDNVWKPSVRLRYVGIVRLAVAFIRRDGRSKVAVLKVRALNDG